MKKYPDMTPGQYLESLPAERREPMEKLRNAILDNLPHGFEETFEYGMIAYVVPKSIYPSGYHCDTTKSLPFLSIASQKGAVTLYHMGLYMSPALMQWFLEEYPKHVKGKPDMGKSCIRFKKVSEIPYGMIGMLVGRMGVAEWIEIYETSLRKGK